jgi:hypothetical protein
MHKVIKQNRKKRFVLFQYPKDSKKHLGYFFFAVKGIIVAYGIDNFFNFQKQLFYAVDKNFPFIFKIKVEDRSRDAAVIRDFLEGCVRETFFHKDSQGAV